MWIYLINTIGVFFLAEFITGIFHFAEDNYGTQVSNKLIQQHIVIPNLEHHRLPLKMTQKSWLQTIKATSYALIVFNIILIPICYLLNILNNISYQSVYFYVTTNLFLCSANLIHKWAHTPKKQLPRIVKFLQDYNILQTHYNHSLHHLELNSDYCVMSNILNKILNNIRFWGGIEYIIKILFNISPRIEKTINMKGEILI